MPALAIGVDIGTTSTDGVLISADGRTLVRATAAYRETCERLRTLYPRLGADTDTRMAPEPT